MADRTGEGSSTQKGKGSAELKAEFCAKDRRSRSPVAPVKQRRPDLIAFDNLWLFIKAKKEFQVALKDKFQSAVLAVCTALATKGFVLFGADYSATEMFSQKNLNFISKVDFHDVIVNFKYKETLIELKCQRVKKGIEGETKFSLFDVKHKFALGKSQENVCTVRLDDLIAGFFDRCVAPAVEAEPNEGETYAEIMETTTRII